MIKSLFRTLILSVTMSAAAYAAEAPQGPIDIYQNFCRFGYGNGWYYSDSQGQQVCFDGDKIFIEGICGVEWLEGSLSADGTTATFKAGEYVDDSTRLLAQYNTNDGSVEIEEFSFTISADRSLISLDNHDGHDVILYTKYDSGYTGIMWTQVSMRKWTMEVPEPAADAEYSYLAVEYENGYDTPSSDIVKMATKGSEIWIKGLVYPGAWLKGEILNNGNWQFEMPQYQGLIARYFSYAYAIWNGLETFELNILRNADGTYSLEEGVDLWRGENSPEYSVMKKAVFTPVDLYIGAPKQPQDVEWSGDFDHIVDFRLPMQGIGGEELNEGWVYWQVLVNGQPYKFSFSEYGDWYFMEYNNTDKIPADVRLNSRIDDEFLSWGKMEGDSYRVILPKYAFGGEDEIEIRCGYNVEDSIYWSEAVKADTRSPRTPLPAEALYSASVSVGSNYGSYIENSKAIYAEFGKTTVRLSGLLGWYDWIEGSYDEVANTAFFKSGQKIGEQDGKDVFLMAARMDATPDGSNPGVFTQIEGFTISIRPGGSAISMANSEAYMIALCDGEIIGIWYPDLFMKIFTEQAPEAPADATVLKYDMDYYNSLSFASSTLVSIATSGDKAWISGMLDGGGCMEATVDGDDIIISFPQYVGVLRGEISYATADPWSFWESDLVLTRDAEGNYSSDGEIWIGDGNGYPIWRACMAMKLTLNLSGVETVGDHGIRLANGVFVSDGNSDVKVFNLSGTPVSNSGLGKGIYIVVAGGKAVKMTVK